MWLVSITVGVNTSAAQRRHTPSAEETRALSLFEQSATAYHEGRFADTTALLEQAYALHPEPVLLYNLARALDAEGEMDEARDAYQRFLASSPEAEQAPLATRRVEVLSAQIADRDEAARIEAEARARAAEPAPEPTPVPEPTPPPRSSPDVLGPVLTLSIGAAVAIVGGVLIGVASDHYQQAVAAPAQTTAVALEHDAYTFRDTGIALLFVGGAAAIAGAVWWIAAATQGPSDASSTSFRIGPGGVSLSGTF